MTTNDIPAIRRLANRSTGTPWTLIEQKNGDRRILAVIADGHGDMLDHALVAEVPLEPGDDNINDWRNDAEFIAAARQIVPNLCDEVEQLRAELAKVAAAIAPTVTINPTSDAARFLHNLYQDWVKTAHERLEQVEQLRAELARADAQLIAANRRADGLHEKNAAAQNALRSLGQAYADLKTDNDDLAAENARLQPAAEAPTDRQCQYGYPLGGLHPRTDWCQLPAGHTGVHKSDRDPIGFTDAGTVKRQPAVAS